MSEIAMHAARMLNLLPEEAARISTAAESGFVAEDEIDCTDLAKYAQL